MSTEQEDLQLRREECRRAVRDYLAARQAVALHPEDIRRGLNQGNRNNFVTEEIKHALAFLCGMTPAQVKELSDGMGATRYYQATSEGVIASEREAV